MNVYFYYAVELPGSTYYQKKPDYSLATVYVQYKRCINHPGFIPLKSDHSITGERKSSAGWFQGFTFKDEIPLESTGRGREGDVGPPRAASDFEDARCR